MSQRPSGAPLASTCWSRVVAAADPGQPEARASLAELCVADLFPLYASVRRKNRFRAFLHTDCVHFLA